MRKYVILLHLLLVAAVAVSCSTVRVSERTGKVKGLPARKASALTGSQFAEKLMGVDPDEREELILAEILDGNFPDFMRRMAEIRTSVEVDGRAVEVRYYVMPDYLSVGCDSDFIRVPMQPATAQKIADSFGCFLSTSKICDDVYAAAVVKLEPRPLTERREDWATFVQHDSIIESQRQGRTGLIAGIKKDVVITDSILMNPRSHRLALYGWHRLHGKPIQPVYTGHVDWYVDYSHGFRLVYRTIYVDGRPMDYVDVMHDDRLRPALTRDPWGKYLRYPTGEDEQ